MRIRLRDTKPSEGLLAYSFAGRRNPHPGRSDCRSFESCRGHEQVDGWRTQH